MESSSFSVLGLPHPIVACITEAEVLETGESLCIGAAYVMCIEQEAGCKHGRIQAGMPSKLSKKAQ